MGRVVLSVLGPVVAEVDGRAVALGGQQQRAVLACLVMQHGAVVSPATLIDRLWPDDPPATATKLIQKYVSGLRASLGGDAIETTGGGYRLAIDPDDVDVVRFERSVGTEPGGSDEHDAGEVWNGPPYSGCGELDFIVRERERLERVRVEARLDRLSTQLERGTFGPTLAELERLAADFPEHERVAALLMRGLYASERQVEALRAYRRHEQYLREELGVDPSPELVGLEARILRHDDSLRIMRAPVTEQDDVSQDRVVETNGIAADADDGTVPVVEEVRPVVIVLASEPSDGAGPEDVRVRQNEFAGTVAGLADRLGAHVEPTVGEEAIVVFGVPAHDDDLDRAVALGRAIVDARPESKVAVVAGDVVVAIAPTVSLVAGSVLDRARSMVADAASGELVADDAIARTAHLWDPTDTTVVGRDHELQLISEIWRRVLADGRLRMVEMIGDAGIGKSRLVQEAIARSDPPPHRVIELGYSSFDDGMLFAALKNALKELSSGFADLEEWLATLDLSAAVRQRLVTQVRPLLEPAADVGADGPDDWVTPIIQLYDAVAAQGPLVVVVEDLHWGRPETIGRLNEAILDLAERPVLVLVTRRPEPRSSELDVRGIAERASLHVEPLTPAAIAQLADEVGGGLDALAQRLAVERSGGNPLFLLHYVQMLLDRPDVTNDTAPDSVRRVIASRLDHLATPLRATIQAASLVPNRMTADVIAAIADRDEHETTAALNVLVRAGLLRRSHGGLRSDGHAFAFHHTLVSHVAYGQLTRQRRIELHRRAAQSLQAASHNTLDDLQAVAWHWRQVIELSHAERVTVDHDQLVAARTAFVLAGSLLLHVDAGASIEMFRRALDLTDDDPQARADLLLRLGAISTDAGNFDVAREALAEAASLYDTIGDNAGAGEALARQARALWYLGRGDDIDQLLTDSLDRLSTVPPSPAHAHAKVVVATQTALRGRSADALELADRVEDIVHEHGTPEDAIRLLHARGHAMVDLDDAAGIAYLEDALRRALDQGFGRLASQSYNNLAEVIWFARGPQEALHLAHDGLKLAVDSGYLGQAPWHVAQIGEISYDVGDWNSLVDAADTTASVTPVVAWLLQALQARVRYWRGSDDAMAELDDALESARITRERQVVTPMLSAAIAAHATADDERLTVSLGEELVSFTRDHGDHRLREAGDAARGLCRIGRPDLVRALVPDQRPTVLRRRLMWETAQANIAELERRWEDAYGHHERAERAWAQFPHPFEAAHAAAGRARAARQLGLDVELVRASEATARARFEQLGATRCIAHLTFSQS